MKKLYYLWYDELDKIYYSVKAQVHFISWKIWKRVEDKLQ